MPSMPSLIKALTAAHPAFSFVKAEHFLWSPSAKTISYNPELPDAEALLLHELSHALLGHRTYRRDIELIAMETVAWEEAKAQALHYAVTINEDTVQDHLDTYRDWLHARSTCPNCTANGYQVEALRYECPACTSSWRVNEARVCELRRYRA